MSDRIEAPWTDEQIAALEAWQRSPYVHPYTCAHRDGHPHEPEYGDHGVLRPTVDGWVCLHCDYTQNWAHTFSLQPVRNPFDH